MQNDQLGQLRLNLRRALAESEANHRELTSLQNQLTSFLSLDNLDSLSDLKKSHFFREASKSSYGSTIKNS